MTEPSTKPPATCSTEDCTGKKKARGLCMKCYMKAYQKTPEYKAYHKAYRQTPKQKAYQKAYQQTPERRAYQKAYYLKKKALSLPTP